LLVVSAEAWDSTDDSSTASRASAPVIGSDLSFGQPVRTAAKLAAAKTMMKRRMVVIPPCARTYCMGSAIQTRPANRPFFSNRERRSFTARDRKKTDGEPSRGRRRVHVGEEGIQSTYTARTRLAFRATNWHIS